MRGQGVGVTGDVDKILNLGKDQNAVKQAERTDGSVQFMDSPCRKRGAVIA